MARLAGLRSYARLAREKLGNQLTAGRFADRGRRRTAWCRTTAVALFFATGPENVYQFEQWRRPLEDLADPTAGVRDRRPARHRSSGARHQQSLPVAFARGSAALESLVERARRRGWCCTSTRSSRTSGCCGSPRRCTSRSGTARATRAAASPTSTRRTTSPSSAGRRSRSAGSALRGFDAEHADPADRPPAAGSRLLRARRTGRDGSGCGSVRPDLGGRSGEHRVRVAGQPRAGDRSTRCWPTRGPGHLPAASADRPGLRRARARPTGPSGPADRDGDRHLIDRGRVRLAVAVRRRLRHRRLRRGVRLAGDREAAGDHRAGRRRPTGRRHRCWTRCRCCRPTGRAGTRRALPARGRGSPARPS